METKKLLPVMGLLFALIIVPAALAQDSGENLISPTAASDQVTAADEADLEVFDVPLGAQYRFLQMQRAITRNILIGTDVVSVLEENHPEDDFTDLHVVLENMESLLNEVKAYEFTDKTLNKIAEDYVTFKKTSIELTQEFRDLARGNLTNTDREQIRSRISGINDSLSQLNDQVRDARREMNAYRVETMLRRMNATNDEIVEKVRTGEAVRNEVFTQLRTAFRAMPAQEKVQALREVKAVVTTRAQVRAAIVQNISESVPAEVRERREERIQQTDNVRARVLQATSNALEMRSRVLNETGRTVWSDRLQQVSDRLEWRAEALRR